MQIVEACLVSILTSVISFALPLLRKCTPCPEPDPQSVIECPRPPGMYGNYVNVRLLALYYYLFHELLAVDLGLGFLSVIVSYMIGITF